MFVSKEHPPQTSDPVRHPSAPSAPAHILARFDQERENASFILSSLRTLFLTPKLQPLHSQKLAHSFTHTESLTPAFPTTSTIFVRSSTKERKLTPLFSSIAVRFCRNVGWGAKKERNSPLQERKSGKGSLRGKQVPNEFRSSSFTVQIRAGVGSTWSPRQRSLGSTWSPRQKKSGLYLGPTSKKSGLYLGPTSKKSGLYLQPTKKLQGTRAE